MQYFSHSPNDTEKIGASLAAKLGPGSVVALFGGLGMGKTRFIAGLAKGLRVSDPVSSPTFALVHEYRGPIPLYHFDMYRVKSADDLFYTGFFDYLEAGGVCALEWSENIEDSLPAGAVRVLIERGRSDDDRIITIDEGGETLENSRG